MTKYLSYEKMEKIVEVLVIIFGLFLLFQILKNIRGGSWGTEEIVIGLLIFNLGGLFTIGILIAQMKSDHDHLKSQFTSLASDFKLYVLKKQKR